MKLLIAAADATLRHGLAAALREADCQLLEVEAGAAACTALLADGAPRIALLALDMPDLDGLEVCRRIRSAGFESGDRYLILVATRGERRDEAACFAAGADDVVHVPVADDALRARVGRALRLHQLHDDRARTQTYLRALLSGISNGVLLSDAAGKIALANDALGDILGGELRGAIARRRADFLTERADHVEPRAAWLQALRSAPATDSAALEFEVAALPSPRIVRWTSRPITLPEGSGQLDVFRDVTLELELQQERALMALVDPVTGLYSRRGAEDTITRELARVRRNGTKLSIALFAVGPEPGSEAGQASDEEALRRIGDVLSLSARMTDITVRYGANELLAVLPETERASAEVFAKRVCTSVPADELRHATATLSVGTAEYDPAEPDLEDAVARARGSCKPWPQAS